MLETNGIPLWCTLFLSVVAVNCVQTLKATTLAATLTLTLTLTMNCGQTLKAGVAVSDVIASYTALVVAPGDDDALQPDHAARKGQKKRDRGENLKEQGKNKETKAKLTDNSSRSTAWVGYYSPLVSMVLMLGLYTSHCVWVTAESYSSPPVMLKVQPPPPPPPGRPWQSGGLMV
jgi:hypothetical protein